MYDVFACFRVAMFSYSKTISHFVSNSIGIFDNMDNNCCKPYYTITKEFFKKICDCK